MQIKGESSERGWGLFPAGWPGEVLRFVIEVWEGFSLHTDVVLEPRITKLLTGAICDRYEREERDWFVVPEFPDWDEESGKEESRTDIRFYPPGPKRRSVCFVFESKRLNMPAANSDEYVGHSGMMCFVLGKYSRGLRCGGMIGYVMDGDLRRANRNVTRAIKRKRKALRITPDGEFRPTPLLPDSTWHGETRHDRDSGVIVLFHLLLPVTYRNTQ
jgi:hypothetical protein